jgi:ABC-2 type transport system ATP-binding protein
VQIINQGKLVYASDMAGLLEQQDTGRYELVLKQAPSLAELNKLSLIRQAEQRGEHSFIVEIDGKVEELARLAVENHWGLQKLAADEKSLENIFVTLTSGDANADIAHEDAA